VTLDDILTIASVFQSPKACLVLS